MKIACDIRMSGKSGIGTFLDEVLPLLAEENNEYLLLSDRENCPLAERLKSKPNVRFLNCPVKMFSLKETFFFPSSLLKEINSCDLYFSPYCNIPSGIKIPVCSTIHDIVFLDVPGLSSKAGTMARKFFYKTCIRRSDRILTVSEFSKGRIQEKLKCRKEISVVYNGVPKYLLARPEGIVKKASSVIYIGNIKKHKGLKTLLEAWPLFVSETRAENPRLMIVGSRENFRTSDAEVSALLDSLTANPETSSQIEFTGYVSDDRLKELLCRARILVQPSLYEGFGIPPLQALAMGTRAVISDIPVFKEIYRDFPVSFFKAADSLSLKEEMKKAWDDRSPEQPLPQVYSYKRTASLILKTFSAIFEGSHKRDILL